MSKLTVMRTNLSLPSESELKSARKVLFDCIRGLTEKDNKSWRRFWKNLIEKESGEIAFIEVCIPRNYKFHKKMFALLSVGFDSWEPDRKRFNYNGRAIEKNFERFRDQVLIMAGHYDQVFSLRGDKMELVAKSISYAAMDDSEFETLYSAVIDVLLREVCVRYKDRAELEAVVERVMGFA